MRGYETLERDVPVDSIYLVAWTEGKDTVYFTNTPYGLSGPEQILRDPKVEAGEVAK